MANCEKIVICGFAGAGKTSLLHAIQKNSPAGWLFADLDELIVGSSHEESVSTLVEKIGWQKFRFKEFDQLMDWLHSPGKKVLALGGGALTEETLTLLQAEPKLKIIYLQVDFESCWRRIENSGELRPLVLKGKNHLKELYQKRSAIFKKVSHRLENKDGQSLNQLAERFWSLVLA